MGVGYPPVIHNHPQEMWITSRWVECGNDTFHMKQNTACLSVCTKKLDTLRYEEESS
ncbi:hypothetical protein PG1528B_1529 [Bifidobacterium animalis subsp. lactis]|nr:hypothetical protein PG1528B_1529 [Bifidobacterium animalis subsp. lactis]